MSDQTSIPTNISTSLPKVNTDETTKTRMQAACSGSLITSFLMTPLDVIKIRLQAQTGTQPVNSSPQLISNSFTSLLSKESPCLFHAPNCKYYHFSNGLMEHICPRDVTSNITQTAKESLVYRGFNDAAVKIVRREGVFALWNGLPPTLIMALPATVLYMMGYDEIKMRLERIPATAPLAPMYSGVLARIIATTAVSPFEVLRTRMQAGLNKETPFTRQLVETFRSGRVIFRGLGATLLRDVPFSGIYWMVLESSKKFLHANAGLDPTHTFMTSFASGAISGMFTAALTTPFDVLKTRLQIEMFSLHDTREQNSRELVKQIYRAYGLKGFWAGVVPRTLRVGFACAVMIATYDLSKKLLSQK